MSKYSPPAEPQKTDTGDLSKAFRLPSTLGVGAMSLSEIAAAVHRAEKLGGSGKTVYAHECR